MPEIAEIFTKGKPGRHFSKIQKWLIGILMTKKLRITEVIGMWKTSQASEGNENQKMDPKAICKN